MRNEEQKERHAEYMREYTKRSRNGLCSVEGCERPSYGRSGLCAMHYKRRQVTGEIGEAAPRFMQGYSVEERFWAKVNKEGSIPEQRPELGQCWEWTAGLFQGHGGSQNGYGSFMLEGENKKAHRVSYVLEVGPIPQGLELDHLCRNRKCVNPAHLEPVTSYENMLRGESLQAQNARKTHCDRGHPLSGSNLKPDPKWGRRICRECANEATRRYRERLRQKQAAQR